MGGDDTNSSHPKAAAPEQYRDESTAGPACERRSWCCLRHPRRRRWWGDTTDSAFGVPRGLTVRPGHSTMFEATTMVMSTVQPSPSEVQVDWGWTDWEHYGCTTR